MKSAPPGETIDIKRTALILTVVILLAVCGYIAASHLLFRVGFPLDDAWIHQTYARNFAATGKWEYIPGEPSSGGSTSPLWTVLVSLGYFLGFNPYAWTFFLGAMALWATALFAERTVRYRVKSYTPVIPWVGILFACEWHLVWAAVSGMETSLYIMVVSLFIWLLFVHRHKTFLLGAVAGLLVWIRPDGSTLLFPLFLTIFLTSISLRERLVDMLKSLLGFCLLAIPYLLFNLQTAGSLLPNTYFAKQTEYAALQSVPLLQRFFELSLQPFIGVGVLLIPMLFYWLYLSIRRADWASPALFLWALILIGSYAIRLPVTYQHGRYEMPVIPVVLILGSLGSATWLYEIIQKGWARLLTTAWLFATTIVIVAFLGQGAWSYANDVAYIESEMVETSKWVAANLPQGDLVAAHDIGALGYFSSHPILDLAGLISPEVIPLMLDQSRIAVYLSEKNTAYLVTFPGWYPVLILNKKPLFTSHSRFVSSYGGENMAVYPWK